MNEDISGWVSLFKHFGETESKALPSFISMADCMILETLEKGGDKLVASSITGFNGGIGLTSMLSRCFQRKQI